jgi:hypothetical protein
MVPTAQMSVARHIPKIRRINMMPFRLHKVDGTHKNQADAGDV